ncbi:MAG TPA: hypothetical protein VNG12_12170 [Acidimicrobiales bacterium]|nr:hypothetical protein [Acidimicrobiales bacterium]
MSDTTQHCAQFTDDLAELALGILTGHRRGATLAHVESCPRCAEELEQLARASDAALQSAPDIEPPMGFEVRLFEAMGVRQPPTRRHVATRWILAAAAAVTALGVGLGVGLSQGSSPPGQTTVLRPSPLGTLVSSSDLWKGGKRVGSVFAYGGPTPWIFMTLSDSAAHGKIICEVVTKSGATRWVGDFTAKSGYGSWGAPLPVAPQDIRSAKVVSVSGTLIASATLT